ncbi:MAG: hypothetical protein LC732_11885, partial [Acidobacteria bacterium]|nr:hypothetical protein [Acidobacteriota bacterium]
MGDPNTGGLATIDCSSPQITAFSRIYDAGTSKQLWTFQATRESPSRRGEGFEFESLADLVIVELSGRASDVEIVIHLDDGRFI